MPRPLNYICSKCDFSDSDSSSWGKYVYKHYDLEVPVHYQMGICYCCSSIAPLEILPSKQHLDFLNGLIEKFPNNASFNENRIKEEHERRTLLKERKSAARCLKCGGHDFEYIPFHEPPVDRERRFQMPWRSGVIHRTCGGRIYFQYSEVNFFGPALITRYFNIEGVKLNGETCIARGC